MNTKLKKLVCLSLSLLVVTIAGACRATDMVFVPAGTFTMGDTFGDGWRDERPVHSVYLDAYFIDKYEVTNQQYRDYLNSANSQDLIEVRNGGDVYADGGNDIYCQTNESSGYSRISWNGSIFTIESGSDSHPMVEVSWFGAKAYAEFYGKRLPTEAEWEKAASWNPVTQTKTKYAWGLLRRLPGVPLHYTPG